MRAYFSYLVDELFEIEERLCQSDLAPHSTALRRAISEAYYQAILARQAADQAVGTAPAAEAAPDPADEVNRAA